MMDEDKVIDNFREFAKIFDTLNMSGFDVYCMLPIIISEAFHCMESKKLSIADYSMDVLKESVIKSLQAMGWQDDRVRVS